LIIWFRITLTPLAEPRRRLVGCERRKGDEKTHSDSLSLSVFLALFFAGCSSPDGGKATRDDPRVRAGQVPVAAAQALTLRFELGHEVAPQEVSKQDAASLLIEDIDGYPLAYLTVLGPKARGGFWQAARAAVAAGEGHYLVATGASKLYSPTLFADTSTDTLEHLLAVADTLGGVKRIKRLVSFSEPGIFYLVDADGNYYDAYNGEAVAPETIEQLTVQFHDMVERLKKDESYRAEMEHVWNCLLGEAGVEECATKDASAEAEAARQEEAELLSSLGYDAATLQSLDDRVRLEATGLEQLTGPDGELDFGKAQQAIVRGGAMNLVDDAGVKPLWNSGAKCVGLFCYGKYYVLEARDKDSDKVRQGVEWHTIGRNWQSWKSYGYRWKTYFDSGHNSSYSSDERFPEKFKDSDYKNFTYRGAISPYTKRVYGGLPVGCGPTAFIRLASWFQFERYQYNRRSNVNWYGVSVPKFPYDYDIKSESYMRWKNNWLGGRMLAFRKQSYNGKYIYIPDLGARMGTGEFYGYGLTFPKGFYNGANSWLDSRKSSLNLYGAWYYARATSTVRWKMYSLAMKSIGSLDEPGVALYPVSKGHHYSPTLEARLYNWRTTAEVLVRVPWGEISKWANNGKFLNITGTYLVSTKAGGYYALY